MSMPGRFVDARIVAAKMSAPPPSRTARVLSRGGQTPQCKAAIADKTEHGAFASFGPLTPPLGKERNVACRHAPNVFMKRPPSANPASTASARNLIVIMLGRRREPERPLETR
jgi:hypothetical protein